MKSTWFGLGIIVIFSSGCGGSVSDPGTVGSTAGAGGQGGTGQASTGQTTGQSTTGQATTGQGGSGQGGSGQGGQAGTGQGGSGPGGSGQGGSGACGARLGDTCGSSEYCDFPDNMCGAADGTGVCRRMPIGCPLILMPTCGCDGKVHENECEAMLARADVSNLRCPPPPGSFSCGPLFCTVKEEYCRRFGSDVGGIPDSYGCKAMPPNCRVAPSCQCLAASEPGGMCDTDAAGNLTVFYPGG